MSSFSQKDKIKIDSALAKSLVEAKAISQSDFTESNNEIWLTESGKRLLLSGVACSVVLFGEGDIFTVSCKQKLGSLSGSAFEWRGPFEVWRGLADGLVKANHTVHVSDVEKAVSLNPAACLRLTRFAVWSREGVVGAQDVTPIATPIGTARRGLREGSVAALRATVATAKREEDEAEGDEIQQIPKDPEQPPEQPEPTQEPEDPPPDVADPEPRVRRRRKKKTKDAAMLLSALLEPSNPPLASSSPMGSSSFSTLINGAPLATFEEILVRSCPLVTRSFAADLVTEDMPSRLSEAVATAARLSRSGEVVDHLGGREAPPPGGLIDLVQFAVSLSRRTSALTVGFTQGAPGLFQMRWFLRLATHAIGSALPRVSLVGLEMVTGLANSLVTLLALGASDPVSLGLREWFLEPQGGGLQAIALAWVGHPRHHARGVQAVMAVCGALGCHMEVFKDHLKRTLSDPLEYMCFCADMLSSEAWASDAAVGRLAPYFTRFALSQCDGTGLAVWSMASFHLLTALWCALPGSIDAFALQAALDRMRIVAIEPTAESRLTVVVCLLNLLERLTERAHDGAGPVYRLLAGLVHDQQAPRYLREVVFESLAGYFERYPQAPLGVILEPLALRLVSGVKEDGGRWYTNRDVEFSAALARHPMLFRSHATLLLHALGKIAISDVVVGRLATVPIVMLLERFRDDPPLVSGFIAHIVPAALEAFAGNELSLEAAGAGDHRLQARLRQILVTELLCKIISLHLPGMDTEIHSLLSEALADFEAYFHRGPPAMLADCLGFLPDDLARDTKLLLLGRQVSTEKLLKGLTEAKPAVKGGLLSRLAHPGARQLPAEPKKEQQPQQPQPQPQRGVRFGPVEMEPDREEEEEKSEEDLPFPEDLPKEELLKTPHAVSPGSRQAGVLDIILLDLALPSDSLALLATPPTALLSSLSFSPRPLRVTVTLGRRSFAATPVPPNTEPGPPEPPDGRVLLVFDKKPLSLVARDMNSDRVRIEIWDGKRAVGTSHVAIKEMALVDGQQMDKSIQIADALLHLKVTWRALRSQKSSNDLVF